MTDQAREPAPAPAISAAEAMIKILIGIDLYRPPSEYIHEDANYILESLGTAGFAVVPIEPDDAAVDRALNAISQFHPTFRHKVLAALRSYTGEK